MIEYLKAKKHKGISEIQLSQLGHINVLCGKNNSGKTSILEALGETKQYALGRKIELDDVQWLKELFSEQTKKFQRDRSFYDKWFSEYIDAYIKDHPVWYSDEIDEIVGDMKDKRKKYFDRFVIDNQNPDFKLIVETLFKSTISNYKVKLIHPKRKFAYNCSIVADNATGLEEGVSTANRLFFLKNQNMDSNEYKIFQKIYSSFNEITNHYFNITLKRANNITLQFSQNEKDWLEGESCGLGLADILLIVTISLDSDASFIFIEGPESHLHPEIQKKVLDFIKNVRSKQFILSTHSSVFLDPFSVDKIYYVFYDKEVKITDETSKSEILQSLGYSVADNLVADMVILTEGPFDIPILQEIFKKLNVSNKYNIKFWPICGDVMTHLDLSVIAEGKNVMALIDSDPGSSKSRTRFMKKCRENGIYCKKLERYSIENYLTLDAIRIVFDDIPGDLNEIKPDKKVDDQIGFTKRNKSIKPKNRKIVEQMSINDIQSTDLFKFCEKIRKYLEEKVDIINKQ